MNFSLLLCCCCLRSPNSQLTNLPARPIPPGTGHRLPTTPKGRTAPNSKHEPPRRRAAQMRTQLCVCAYSRMISRHPLRDSPCTSRAYKVGVLSDLCLGQDEESNPKNGQRRYVSFRAPPNSSHRNPNLTASKLASFFFVSFRFVLFLC